jgi:aryl-alcohol dehydrogenase-like predicted oxidoreductase
MRYKTIGSNKTIVPAIGIGCMGLGGYFKPDTSADQDIIKTLHLAFDYGMTFLDTAEVYAGGHCEELVGLAIKDRRNKVYVATKVSPENLQSNSIIKAAEASLKRLHTDYIDLYQVHWPNPKIPIEESIDTLESLVKAGKIRHIGLSNFSLNQLRKAQSCLKQETMAAVQVEYNLFDRSIESEFLPYCQNENITFIAYSPLDQGHICGGPLRYEMLQPIAKDYNCSVAQLALAWLIRQSGVMVIPKALKPDHVISNAKASELELSTVDAEKIECITDRNFTEIPVNRIRVADDDTTTQRQVYRTVEEARANIYGFSPSPTELAEDIRSGDLLKAVRVRRTSEPSDTYDYELIEGRIRYWSWVIAFEGKRNIPVLIRE